MLMMFLYERRARAPARLVQKHHHHNRKTHFGLIGTRRGQKPKKSRQSTKAAGPAPATRPKIGQRPGVAATGHGPGFAMKQKSMLPTLHHWTSVFLQGAFPDRAQASGCSMELRQPGCRLHSGRFVCVCFMMAFGPISLVLPQSLLGGLGDF